MSYRAIIFSLEKSIRDACTIASTAMGEKGDVRENVYYAHNGIKIQPDHLLKHETGIFNHEVVTPSSPGKRHAYAGSFCSAP